MFGNKIKISVLAFVSGLCLLLSAVCFNFASAAETVKEFIVHGTSYSATGKYENNEYSLYGTQGRGRVGMIINQPLNVRQTISFDMKLTLNDTYTPDETTLRNRTYILSLNQYELNEEGLPKTAGNTFSTASGPNGVQIQFIPKLDGYDGPVARLYARGTSYFEVPLKSVDGYFVSALYGGKNNGAKTALDMIKVEASIVGDDYVVTLQCYDAAKKTLAGNVASLSAPLSVVSASGGFISDPYLGFYLVNEAGSALGQTTDVDVNFKIKGLVNGRIKRFTFEETEIRSLKPEQNVILKPKILPWNAGDDLSDITYSYESSAADVVQVSPDGVLSTSADGGYAVITARTSEGNTCFITVLVYDDVLPTFGVNGEVVKNGNQYERIVLPEFIDVSDNSGIFTKSLRVVSPETIIIDAAAGEYSFIPHDFGKYVVVYAVKDAYGNVAEKRFTIDVEEAPNSGLWTVYKENYAYNILEETDGGDTLNAELTVGSLENGESLALVYSNKPITFTKKADGTWTSFSFKISVDIEDISWRAEAELDRKRMLTLYLMEAYEDGTIGAEQFNRDRKGMEMAFGVSPDWTNKTAMRYRLRSYKTADMSEQNISSMDTYSKDLQAIEVAKTNRNGRYGKGATYLPWFSEGQALDFADKFINNGTVNVTVEYFEDSSVNDKGKIVYDRYYKWSFDNFAFKVPADYVNGNETGYERQAFFGFKLWSNNGVVKYNVRISDMQNGEVKNVSFNEGTKSLKNFGDDFILSPYVFDNDGNKLATEFSFKSGDTSIATVDENGIVRIVGYGVVSIFATSSLENKSATHTVSVDVPIFELEKSEYTLPLGKDGTLLVITGAKFSVPILFSSSDPFGLVALEGGTLQGIKEGDYTVTASYLGYTAECTVHVVKTEEKNTENFVSDKSEKSGCSGNIGINGFAAILAAAGICAVLFNLSARKKYD